MQPPLAAVPAAGIRGGRFLRVHIGDRDPVWARVAARRHIRSARRAALRRVAEDRDRPAPPG